MRFVRYATLAVALAVATLLWCGPARADQEADAGLALTRAQTALAGAQLRLAQARLAEATAVAAAAASAAAPTADPNAAGRPVWAVPQQVVAAEPSPFAVALASFVGTAAEALLTIVGIVITALVTLYAPRAIAAVEGILHIKLDDQQRQAVYNAIETGRGQLETMIDQGRLKVSDITTSNETVRDVASDALKRVPDSADAQKMTISSATEILVGRVDTSPKPMVIQVPAKPTVVT